MSFYPDGTHSTLFPVQTEVEKIQNASYVVYLSEYENKYKT